MVVRHKKGDPAFDDLFEGNVWQEAIELSGEDTILDAGWVDTGITGWPPPGLAFATPERDLIYVRQDEYDADSDDDETLDELYKGDGDGWSVLRKA